jgi:pyruvate/2-oxoglutarate dehydrogenase complex dihydrolipoamide acyltransferase (E2) component
MPIEVVMPKLGLNMSEGRLLEWLRKEGDSIQRGDPLFVVETDKVTTESEAQVSGILGQDPGFCRGNRARPHSGCPYTGWR